MWLLGSKRRIGWGVSLINQVMWVALGVVTGATGFYASAAIFTFLAIRGWRNWKPSPPPAVPEQIIPVPWDEEAIPVRYGGPNGRA